MSADWKTVAQLLSGVEDAVARRRREHAAADRKLWATAKHAIDSGAPATQVAQAAGVDRTTVYQWLRKLEETEKEHDPADPPNLS